MQPQIYQGLEGSMSLINIQSLLIKIKVFVNTTMRVIITNLNKLFLIL